MESLCFVLEQDTFSAALSTGSTQEAPSKHDRKIVDGDVLRININYKIYARHCMDIFHRMSEESLSHVLVLIRSFDIIVRMCICDLLKTKICSCVFYSDLTA